MIEILKHTPYWVYITFTVVLYFGLSACFENKIKVRHLWYLPVIFILLSVYGVITSYGWTTVTLVAWAVAWGGAAMIVYLFTVNRVAAFRKIDDTLVVPGEVSILLVSLFFFAVKFWFGYTTATDENRLLDPSFQAMDSLSSGFVVGFFCGRGLSHFSIAKRLDLKLVAEE